MIRAVSVDDEENGRQILRHYVNQYSETLDLELVGEADSVASGIELINRVKPDLVFLDVQLQDGTGFNLLEKLNRDSFKVVFVTSYDQYALKAIRFKAIDYILKPIDPDLFVEAVEKVKADLNKFTIEKDVRIDELVTNINSFEKIGLPSIDCIRFVKVSDIVRCEADGNYTKFVLSNNESIIVCKTMKVYEDLLAEYKFIRIHKSHLINVNYVDKYINGDGGTVIMSDGSSVEVSRRKKEDLLKLIVS